ncbi:hypothetical protein LTR65_010479 [Meristemomyces frigidus]
MLGRIPKYNRSTSGGENGQEATPRRGKEGRRPKASRHQSHGPRGSQAKSSSKSDTTAAKKPAVLKPRTSDQNHVTKAPKLSNTAYKLLRRYRERQQASSLALGRTSGRTIEQICVGHLDNIAYDNLIELVKRHTMADIVRMVNEHPHPEGRLNRHTVSKCTLYAITIFAEDQGVTQTMIVAQINAHRARNGVEPLVHEEGAGLRPFRKPSTS